MKRAWSIVQAGVLALGFILIAIPVSMYIILSTEWAQNDIRKVAANELSALLGTDLTLGKVEIHPFNRLSIYDVEAHDDFGKTALRVDEISVAFELFHLMRTGKLVIDYALVDGPDLNLYKESESSPLNIANIIENLKSDRPQKQHSQYDLMVNTVIVRDGVMHFDILDKVPLDSVFDKNHIALYDIFLNAYIPRIANDEYRVEIDRFSFADEHGFKLSNLKAAAHITPAGSNLEYLNIQLPNSSLSFSPISLDNHGFSDIIKVFRNQGINVGIQPGSVIYPPDLSEFVPALSSLDEPIRLILSGLISDNKIEVERITFAQTDDNFISTISAAINGLKKGVDASYAINDFKISSNKKGLKILAEILPSDTRNSIDKIIDRLDSDDSFSANITGAGKLSEAQLNARLAIADNSTEIGIKYTSPDTFQTVKVSAETNVQLRDLAKFAGETVPSAINASISANGLIAGSASRLSLSVDSANVYYKGHKYESINLSLDATKKDLSLNVTVDDPLLSLNAGGSANFRGKITAVDASVEVISFDPYALMLIDRYEGYNLSGKANTCFEYSSIDNITGYFTITDLNYRDEDSLTDDLVINSLTIEAAPTNDQPGIKIQSDFMNANVYGPYKISTLANDFKMIIDQIFPAIGNHKFVSYYDSEIDDYGNDFTYNIDFSECENLCRFFNLPVSIIHDVTIDGHFSSYKNSASLFIDAPYLLQGDKIIENTSLKAEINGSDDRAFISATSKIPTKKGPLTAKAELFGSSNRIDNRIEWNINRKIPINGSFKFTCNFTRDFNDQLATSLIFNPGTLTFGTDIWSINPSVVTLAKNKYEIHHFGMNSSNKSISINGTISPNENDIVKISLNNVALLEIFETLEIDKALIGGTATGDFTGRALLSDNPEIYSRNLHVDGISYNRCVLGNADIIAFWDNGKRSFNLNADVIGDTGLHSYISGDIFPAGEALDISFDVNHVPVGFMKPYMEAFASDLNGYASGRARLFGTFKYIDLEGDVYADDLNLKIAFTNTWYSATDSIHIRPGEINIDHITIKDINGNTAMLNGVVKHTFFKEPTFNFTVTNAHNFLSYNVDSRQSPDWYGTIYGNGGATVSGEPGIVNIGVNMSTAPNSSFTFVLSDRLDADEYSFITFKDSRAEARRDSLLRADKVPSAVRLLQKRLDANAANSSSAYNMDFQIDITPDARMTLVMDPVGGDEIKATGSGNLRMTYESLNNDLKMYGTYTLNRGNYNFTLQDIIIKDFTIKEGSSIAFHGDPYSAQLDINAIYAVNANLSDLDESFLLDKDLNRTNVPVHALLKVTGDMRQPDIDFDLEFPTLTQDTYRKVRSIVSTQDMMNRQIIYLLALNRFYTPDYMASTTKGNELFSVASSTISSQLSSMLGKLSDDWSIAPNLRSDRGDFSDVEVDVALSSRLLNNRLLFNGNFGYRDKTLNTNQFIGDFDIEYLLNPKGTWRLKAYNRYNDQNYYVRTAQTTQGIGLVFKRDFDNFFGFLRPKKKKLSETKQDSINNIVIPDSIAHPTDPGINQ